MAKHPALPPTTKQNVSKGDIDGDSLADNLTTTEFSTSCSCPETPAPTAAPIRVLPVNGTCGEPLDEILVKSTFNPELEGCYKETLSTNMDLPMYTVSGTNASEQIYMFALEQDDFPIVSPTTFTVLLLSTRGFSATSRWRE